MSDQTNRTAADYLEQRIGELYGAGMASKIAAHIRAKTAQLRENSEEPMQNSLNRLVYPFMAAIEAMGIEGIPAEEASPILTKLWEEMPNEIKLSGLNTMCES